MPLPVTDPVLIFGLAMALILLAPLLFERLRLPGLVGLIAAGALVGPSALGLLARDATMELLGTVGLLYLMFTAGLSIDLNQFMRLRTRSLVFGSLSFVVPLLLAIALGPLLLGYGWPAALLLGSIIGSHTLLAYPVARRLGIDRRPPVVMTMGGTMVTDLLALLLLAVVVAAQAGTSGALFWARFGVGVGLYGAVVAVGLPVLGRWFIRTVRQPDARFAFLMAAVFLLSYGARLAGLAPIIGAFLSGLVLNRLVPEQSPLMTRIRFVGDALLVPFFLLSVGMLVDVEALVSSVELWGVALLLTGMVWTGKGLAVWLTQRLYRLTTTDARVMFGLSTPQAAATLAVTLIGYDIGLFDELGVNAVVAMILATCVLGPYMVERYGRQMARQETAASDLPEGPQRILVSLANPETAEDLIDLTLLLREETSEEPVYPMTVVRDGPDQEAQVAAGEEMLGRAVVHAAAADVPVTPVTRIDLNVANGIVRASREIRASTIVMGWNGRTGTRALVFGSVFDQILQDTQQAVVVCRIHHPLSTANRLLLAVPPTVTSEPGLAVALRSVKLLAQRAGADLVVLAPPETLEIVTGRLEAVKPDVPVKAGGLARWGALPETLEALVGPSDLVVLLSAREGAIGWSPTLNRLPRTLAHRFPESNFVTVYPPEVSLRDRGSLARAHEADLLLRAEDIEVFLPERDEAAALTHLLEATLAAEGVPTAAVRERLLRHTGEYAVELAPGVVFYHAHTGLLTGVRLLIGVAPQGLRLPSTERAAHVMVVLLAPHDMPTEAYLRELGIVARLFGADETVAALRAAESPEAVRALLLEGARMAKPERG